MIHILYFKYVVRHKWFVFWAGIEIGPEYYYQWPVWFLRLLLHDWDKFTPVEWHGYIRRFAKGNDFSVMGDDDLYNMAWHMHSKRNKHHWEWWITVRSKNKVRVLPMDTLARREMLSDWYGMGRSLGLPDIPLWYTGRYDDMTLHPETRAWINGQLKINSRYFEMTRKNKV